MYLKLSTMQYSNSLSYDIVYFRLEMMFFELSVWSDLLCGAIEMIEIEFNGEGFLSLCLKGNSSREQDLKGEKSY